MDIELHIRGLIIYSACKTVCELTGDIGVDGSSEISF
jgi:hypothetical protein